MLRYSDGDEVCLGDRVDFDGDEGVVIELLETPEQFVATGMHEPAVGFKTTRFQRVYQSPNDRGWESIRLLTRGESRSKDVAFDGGLQVADSKGTTPEQLAGMLQQFRTTAVGRRYRSSATFFGVPLVSIATGPDLARGEFRGVAKGIIAIGDIAIGVLSLGGLAMGIVSIGGMSLGLLSLGGMSIGLLVAVGGGALGMVAFGGAAIGVVACGGLAIGVWAVGATKIGLLASAVFGLLATHR